MNFNIATSCTLSRSQIVLSESLSIQSPKSPYRRAPSTFMKFSGNSPSLPVKPLNLEESADDVLKVAKSDIAKLSQKLQRKRVSWRVREYVVHMVGIWLCVEYC